MTSKLHISTDLALPLDWMTLATVVYGARGSGKTTFGCVVAEELSRAHQRWCAVDLKGDFYGIKSARDGKREGIPAIIFGGDHADVPLEEGAGAFVGETVAGLDQSCILDLEHLSKGKQVRFLSAFFERLYDKNREPLLMLLDEAQRYAPQGGGRGQDPAVSICLGAVEDLVKLGRKHGLGVVLLTQRGSGLNKEVSELCDLLVAFRTPGPLDQDRIEGWLDANTTKAQRIEVMGQLAGLPTGTAVFASGHPDLKLFGVHRVRQRETFDSSATPKVGARRAEPALLAKPDLEQLRVKMAETIERAKAADPRALRAELATARKRIAELERELQREKERKHAGREKRVEVPAIREKDLEELNRLIAKASALAGQITGATETARHTWGAAREAERLQVPQQGAARAHTVPHVSTYDAGAKRGSVAPRPLPAAPRASNGHGAEGKATAAERKLLTALAQHQEGVSRAKLGVLTGYRSDTGHFGNMLSKLRSCGWVEGDSSCLRITQGGLDELGPYTPLPTGAELLEYWVRELAPAEGKVLRAACEAYPDALTRADLGARTGYRPDTGHFGNLLSKLRSLSLIRGSGELRASEDLFG